MRRLASALLPSKSTTGYGSKDRTPLAEHHLIAGFYLRGPVLLAIFGALIGSTERGRKAGGAASGALVLTATHVYILRRAVGENVGCCTPFTMGQLDGAG